MKPESPEAGRTYTAVYETFDRLHTEWDGLDSAGKKYSDLSEPDIARIRRSILESQVAIDLYLAEVQKKGISTLGVKETERVHLVQRAQKNLSNQESLLTARQEQLEKAPAPTSEDSWLRAESVVHDMGEARKKFGDGSKEFDAAILAFAKLNERSVPKGTDTR
jgi:hypothetical protein